MAWLFLVFSYSSRSSSGLWNEIMEIYSSYMAILVIRWGCFVFQERDYYGSSWKCFINKTWDNNEWNDAINRKLLGRLSDVSNKHLKPCILCPWGYSDYVHMWVTNLFFFLIFLIFILLIHIFNNFYILGVGIILH